MKGDHYVVMTHWKSKEDFERWTDSHAFMDAHAKTPPKEAFTGPSKLEVHEIIAESPAGTNLS
jgi:heme-degrading monooxygenase HmoA